MRWIGTRIKSVGVVVALVGALAVGVAVGGATLGIAGAADSPGGSGPKLPSAADRAKLRQQLDAFRACIKAHGVDLPEPPAPGQGGEGFRRGLPPGVDRDKLRAAHDACKDKLPPHPGGPIGPIGGPIGGRVPGSGPGSGGATDPQGAGTPV